jgi:hypothetical protein
MRHSAIGRHLRYHTHQPYTQTTLPHNLARQVQLGNVSLATRAAPTANEHVLNNANSSHRKLNHLPPTMNPTATKRPAAVRTNIHGMLYYLCRNVPLSGERTLAFLAFGSLGLTTLGTIRLHPIRRAACFATAVKPSAKLRILGFQHSNALLQFQDDRYQLLPR